MDESKHAKKGELDESTRHRSSRGTKKKKGDMDESKHRLDKSSRKKKDGLDGTRHKTKKKEKAEAL